MSNQLRKRDKSDERQVVNYRETVCVVKTPEGRAADKRLGSEKDKPAYIIFSILSLICSVGGVLSLEMVNTLKLLCMIPAALALVFAIVAKSKRSGVLSIMAMVFSIIGAVAVCSISLACVCVRSLAKEMGEEYIAPLQEFYNKWAEKLPFLK